MQNTDSFPVKIMYYWYFFTRLPVCINYVQISNPTPQALVTRSRLLFALNNRQTNLPFRTSTKICKISALKTANMATDTVMLLMMK